MFWTEKQLFRFTFKTYHAIVSTAAGTSEENCSDSY